MPVLPLVAITAFGLCLATLGLTLFARPDPRRQLAAENLRRGLAPIDDPEVAITGSGGARRGGLTVAAVRLTPPGTAGRIDRLLSRSGRPQAWPMERILVGKLLLGVGFASLGLLYAAALDSLLVVLMSVGVALVAYFVPELLLVSRGIERSQKIDLELPDTLDQMTIAVEAGLGFDAAMARAGQNGTGPLAQELVRTLQDIQLGRSRRQAYESLAGRTGTADLRRFIRAIIQADAYGISVADVLRTQAAEMRVKRRQRAEHKAMQLPVKVVFPLMFCILPVLFIVLLGPVLLNVLATFS